MTYERNNIYNVDCYKAIKEIPDKSIDIIYTDIPYKIESGGGGSSKISQRIVKLNYGDLANIRDGIDYSILDEFVRIQPSIYIYIWCSKLQIFPIMKYFVEKHNCNYNILCWCKTNPIPATNGCWLPDIEYCLVFKENNTPKYNDGYDFKSKWYVSAINQNDKKLYEHPTIKPLELVERHLKHSCKQGMVVLDPFLGSGTTAVACKNLGIDYIGFEVDSNYYNIAKDRLNGIKQSDIDKKENMIQEHLF